MRIKEKKKLPAGLFLTIISLLVISIYFSGCQKSSADNFVSKNGRLQVIGTQLCNNKKEPIQLKGMSMLDVSWFREYSNKDCFAWLHEDWNMTVFRAALYTEYNNRFVGESQYEYVEKAVQAAVDAGVYVIIDWHILSDKNPQKYKKEAIDFFDKMSKLYKDTPNVMYEICNEPNGDDVTWSNEIKPYAIEIIETIRKNDKKNVILVGTPTWSRDVDTAADDPLPFENIIYVFHFYAGSHGDQLRNKVDIALSKGAPIFVTEWGTSMANGSGGVFPYESFVWINFLDERKISWANWSLSTRKETSAALKSSASPEGSWADSDLTESGLIVRSLMRGDKTAVVFADGFETKNFTAGCVIAGWIKKGKTQISKDDPYKGSFSAIFSGNSLLEKSFPAMAYANPSLSFAYRTESLQDGDFFFVEWFDGLDWLSLKELPASGKWQVLNLSFPPEANNNPAFQFRFSTSLQNESSKVFLDEVLLTMERSM